MGAVSASQQDLRLEEGRDGEGYELVERPEWSTWVTPKQLVREPIHRWFVFPHSFSPQLVRAIVEEWDLDKGATLLDPFVGSGTTILAGASRGLRVCGFDLSPLAEFASRVKVWPPSADGLRNAWKVVRPQISVRGGVSINAGYEDLVVRAFPGDLLATLDGARRSILGASLGSRERDALLLALLSILPAFSRLVRKGGWLEERGWSLPAEQVVAELDAKVSVMISDLVDRGDGQDVEARVGLADARSLPVADGSVSAIVTSPPYANRHDYTRVFGVELQFGFLGWEEIRALRHQSFSSHPEARPQRGEVSGYREPDGVRERVERIGALITDARAKERIPRMLRGYFEDLFVTLKEMRRTLLPHGRMALVLGNVSYCGIPLEVDQLAIEVGRQVGLAPLVVYVARWRGNSAQQMKVYGRRPQRESIVVFEASVPW